MAIQMEKQEQKQKINKVDGAYAALTVLFIFGLFIGLPLIVWPFWLAAVIGLWIATPERRAVKREEQRSALSDRPWRNN
jgi:hypothetical protein